MHTLLNRFKGILLALALLCVGPLAEASAQSYLVPFELTPNPTSLTIDWKTLKTGARTLIISNNTMKEVKLKLRLGTFTGPDPKEQPTDFSGYLKLDPSEVSLPAAGTATVSILAQEPPRGVQPAPGNYTGSLILFNEPAASPPEIQTFIRKPITLGFPELRTPPAPAVSKMTVRVVRAFPSPFFSTLLCNSLEVPLQQSTASAPTGTPRVFSLTRGEGGVATVRQKEGTEAGGGGKNFATFEVEDVFYAGKYEGGLSLGPRTPGATAGNDVNLTIQATDFIIWPIILLAISIGLTQASKYFINVKRQIWSWHQREAEVGVAYKQSKRGFSQLAAEHSLYTIYSIEGDLITRRKTVLERIKALEDVSWVSLREPPVGEGERTLSDELEWLVARVRAWERFPTHVIKLRDELSRAYPIDGATASPDGTSGRAGMVPSLVKTCSVLVVGGPLTVTEFEARGAQLTAHAAFVQIWGGLYWRLMTCLHRVEQLEPLDAHDPAGGLSEETRTQLAEAKQELKQIFDALWEVPPEGHEEIRNIDKSLASIEARLLQLKETPSLAHTELKMLPSVNSLPAPASVAVHNPASLLSGIEQLNDERDEWRPRRKETDDRRAEHYRAEIKRWDILTVILAALIAVVTGLQSYYFGISFGTLKDYAGLFVWAVGTQAAIEALSAILGRLIPSLKISRSVVPS